MKFWHLLFKIGLSLRLQPVDENVNKSSIMSFHSVFPVNTILNARAWACRSALSSHCRADWEAGSERSARRFTESEGAPAGAGQLKQSLYSASNLCLKQCLAMRAGICNRLRITFKADCKHFSLQDQFPYYFQMRAF